VPLLGWPLVTVLSVLVVAAVTGTLVVWGRVRGPRAARAAQRVGLVLLCQLTAVFVLGAALNDWAYFYGSWSDLLGTNKAVQQSVLQPPVRPAFVPSTGARGDGHRLQALGRPAMLDKPVAAETSWSTPGQWTTRGRIEAVELTGQHSGLGEQALVYLPPQYFQQQYAGTSFPAVEVMTGYPGTTRLLVARMHYPDVLLRQIRSHRARPMVLVMLRPTVVPPRDTECTDVPSGPQTLTYFAEDVPRLVSSSFRVEPTGWGAMGDSTGGYCATKMAMTHSSVFRAAVSLSGYYHTLRDGTTGDLWGGSPQLRQLNDLEWLLRHQPAPPVSVFATTGSDERGPTGVRDLRSFAALVRRPMSITTVTEPGGGHNFNTWARVMPTAFSWLSARLGA
jgi:enterochelin esterase-like enzyme